jgi:membrane-associated phospholipid phosphatase
MAMNGIGLQIVLWFQSWRGPLMEAYARVFDFMGLIEFYLILLPLIYWCIDTTFGRRLGVLLLASQWSNTTLQEWWARPRPYQVSDQVSNLKTLDTYGMPSGHTQGATTLWGMVGLRLRRDWVTALVVAYVILMGISRLVMGVHFPQDVLVGWTLGLLWLGAYLWLEPRTSRWLTRQSVWTLIGLVLGITALGLLIQPILMPFSTTAAMEFSITSLGAFLGMGIGFVLETRYLGFDARGVWWKRLLRFALGIAVLMGLRSGLKSLFAGLEPVILFRLIRYVLMSFWVSCAAPWAFVKTKLADHTDR